MAKRILILDTPDAPMEPLAEAFRTAAGEGAMVERVFAADRLLEKLAPGLGWDLIVIDAELGDGQRTGLDLLESVRTAAGEVPVVAAAAEGSVDLAAAAVRAGANDLLVRTGRLDQRAATLLGKLTSHMALVERNRMLREQNRLLEAASRGRQEILGASPQIQAVLDQIRRVGLIPRPVLIAGPRGTGKELVARAIHAAGGTDRPLVTVNCAAFPDTLLESELFGYEKGAFTGAEARTHGKIEQADGGTLFLDEIGNMSLPFQQKILRVVEYGTFTRVGGREEIAVSVRVIAATNVDLEQRMAAGEFLRDLYDRLSFEVISIPPLRDRTGDVELLARHFLVEFMKEIPALSGKVLSRRAIDVLSAYHFPGNVRELKNIIERAAYRDTTNEITPEDIGMLPTGATGQAVQTMTGTFTDRVEDYKRTLILGALEAAGGNGAQAARILGLSYHQFRYYLSKYQT